MGNRNERLYTIPFQDARLYCGKCDYVKRARAELDSGNLTAETLGDMRAACISCRTTTTRKAKTHGIYKADAILGIYRAQGDVKPQLPPGKGKTSIIPERTKDAIWEQVQAGVTYR